MVLAPMLLLLLLLLILLIIELLMLLLLLRVLLLRMWMKVSELLVLPSCYTLTLLRTVIRKLS
jgi:hypothetical protein